MFDNLVESRGKQQRSWRQAVASVSVHGAVIFAVVKATQGAAEVIRPTADTSMVFTVMKAPKPEAPAAAKAASPPPSNAPAVMNPPPEGFKTISAPIDIPKDIPPINFDQKPLDPMDFTGRGVEGGSRFGVIGGLGTVDGSGTGGQGLGGNGSAYSVNTVDDPPEVISVPDLRYPPALERALISGQVELQYVIDTTGRAEPHSFKVLSQTHESFVESAEATVRKARFRPARKAGHPVRVEVQQLFRFNAKEQ